VAEPIVMLLGMLTRVGPRNYVLGAFFRDTGLVRTVYPLQDVRRQKTIRDVQYGAVLPVVRVTRKYVCRVSACAMRSLTTSK